ncbi:hypothetical protein AB6B38_06170 [Glycocaulis abyssi]|uniref:N-acetyltransferase domain-containing protein n=1 Tax=Glycocaulis abyssi TaxID=1433403 RepID=A0ABV9N8P6_9PROT
MAAVTIRQVHEADLPAIVPLVDSCGFPARSLEGWRWVLFGNPQQGDIAPGWVAESGGRVSGFLGNFVNRYRCGTESYVIATGHTVVTDRAQTGRLAGLKLIRHGLAQPDVDAFVTLNNNALSAPLLARVGAKAWLGQRGREWAEWVFRPDRIVLAALPGRENTERFDCGAGFAFDISGRRGDAVFEPLDTVSDEELAALAPAGHMSREISQVSLRYRAADPDRRGGMEYVVARLEGRALAVAALLLTKAAPGRLDHAEVVDWAASPCADGVRAQSALLRHLVSVSRRAGASRMRLHFPAHLPEGVLKGVRPHLRRVHSHDPCHTKTRHAGLTSWRPGPGDADYFFAFRIPPALYCGA